MDMFDEKGIKPMLISERVDPYDDVDSIFELKFDGIRCIAYIDDQSTDLRNKRNMMLLPRFPELELLHEGCKQKCILDGELIVLVNGKPDFYEVQRRTVLTDPFKIELAYKKHPAGFVAYDILYYKDKPVTDLPLMERKKLLDEVISESDILSKSRYIETDGIAMYKFAEDFNLEGVVGKKKSSLYWFGKKSKEWKKIKVLKEEDFICIGYMFNKNSMTTLILAKYDDKNKLIITNHVSLGVSIAKLKQHGMKISDCPIDSLTGYADATWIEPMVCTIEYMPSEKEGIRQPTFKSVRVDKLPEKCRLHNTH
ncbi:bifunctional non-homologous end joining protein LigD [Lacrimispora sphenoides]|uniref:ATP-dependent DNA ligase n=1 Tax=Lacrimispora sphenoides TaxID=29370 RepID=UPI0008BF74C3|nr:DNA ligase [Lacrimispora sphenoides]SEU07953.1 bifunctional non-homologous end joining protein LigD [Lacrimispora sphenoides]